MISPLAIAQMSVEEKLQTMEALWLDLCREESAIVVSEWQKRILDERESLVSQGQTRFMDWEQAKEDIARETS